MKINRPYLAVLVAQLALLASCSTLKPPATDALLADDYTLVKAYLHEYIPKAMKRAEITGLSVALIDGQRIVWTQGFGLADKEASIPATADTRYRAGSVSKLFTAIAVMQQVEAGQLSLDAPLSRSVPEFKLKSRFGSIDAITLRNTLSHHSGIPGAYIDGMYSLEPESFKTVADHLGNYYAAYPPNTVFSYSNAGYSLAGYAVENASERPFVDYMEERVLEPFGMKASNFSMDVSDALVAKSYWNDKPVEELSLRDLPAGGLVTDVGDLSQLVRFLHANTSQDPAVDDSSPDPRPGDDCHTDDGRAEDCRAVISRDSLSQIIAAQEYDSPYELSHFNGIGFLQYYGLLNGNFRAVGHGGQTMAHSASLITVPELKLGVVLLANSPDFSGVLGEITNEILKVAYPVKAGKALGESVSVNKMPLPGSEAGFEGIYASEYGLVSITGAAPKYKVRALGTKLSLVPGKSEGHTLKMKLFGFIPVASDEFDRMTFHARRTDTDKLIVMDTGTEQVVVATEVTRGGRNQAWDARLGRYEPTNPIDTDIKGFHVPQVVLGYEDGLYFLDEGKGNAASRVALEIMSDTEATFQGVGRGLGETLLATGGTTIAHQGLVFDKMN